MKSILILGSTGMLGYGVLSSLVKYNNINISVSVRSKKTLKKISKKFPYNKVSEYHILDALKINKVKLNKIINKYDFVINCIGIIKPEINLKDAQSIKNTIKINSLFPNILSNSVLNKKTKIFQIATDCVFSGKNGRYNELSKHDDLDIYGISKSIGEIEQDNFYNLRTSIIGKEFLSKKSLVEWFLSQRKEVNGFVNHNWNGVTTQAYGEYLYTIINNEIEIPNLLHVIPKNILNKYELLKIFKKKFNSKIKINKFKTTNKVDRSLSTIYQSLNNRIWKKSVFKLKPSIEKLIMKI